MSTILGTSGLASRLAVAQKQTTVARNGKSKKPKKRKRKFYQDKQPERPYGHDLFGLHDGSALSQERIIRERIAERDARNAATVGQANTNQQAMSNDLAARLAARTRTRIGSGGGGGSGRTSGATASGRTSRQSARPTRRRGVVTVEDI